MPREFPDFVDPWKAADGKRVFEGTMPLKWMRRLAPLLADEGSDSAGRNAESRVAGQDDDLPPLPWGDVSFRARFGHDEQGVVTIDLQVEGDLPLVCQRSMRPYRERVRRRSLLGVVESAAAEGQLPAHLEPVLVDNGRLALLEMVEDELLLAVPQVPRDPAVGEVLMSTDGSPEAEDNAGGEPRQRPFGDLAELIARSGRRN